MQPLLLHCLAIRPTSAVNDGRHHAHLSGIMSTRAPLLDPPNAADLRLGGRHHARCRRRRTGLTDRQRHHLGDRRRMDAEQAAPGGPAAENQTIGAELGPVGDRGRSSRRSLPRSWGDRSEGPMVRVGLVGGHNSRISREFSSSHHWNARLLDRATSGPAGSRHGQRGASHGHARPDP